MMYILRQKKNNPIVNFAIGAEIIKLNNNPAPNPPNPP